MPLAGADFAEAGDGIALSLASYGVGRGVGAFSRLSKSIGSIKIPVYRVDGGGASMYGRSYSLINPKYVPNYRNFAGLQKVNSGKYLLKAHIPLRNIRVGRWFASPLNGNTGGLPFEFYLNYTQLINKRHLIINKPF